MSDDVNIFRKQRVTLLTFISNTQRVSQSMKRTQSASIVYLKKTHTRVVCLVMSSITRKLESRKRKGTKRWMPKTAQVVFLFECCLCLCFPLCFW
jgi:hypothetical protein